MKLTIERNLLVAALARASRIVERRVTIPILANILLRAGFGKLSLTATDLDLELTESVAADIAAEGAVTVPAATLHDIARKLPDGAQASIEAGADGKMLIRSGRARFTLGTLPASDFPSFDAGEPSARFSLPAKVLHRLFATAQFAISDEETRYYLNGIFFHTIEAQGETKLRAVATDGHRLARVEAPAPQGSAGMPGIIVPKKAVGEIVKLCEAFSDAAPSFEISPTKLRFSVGEIALTTKLIDGTFPDYQRVIPTGNEKILTVDMAGFAQAVDRVSTISSERGRAVKLAIGDGKVALSVADPDRGTASEECEADYGDAAIEIGFNARYLLDIAGEIGGDTLRMALAEPGSPTILQSREGSDALFVLMPMRV